MPSPSSSPANSDPTSTWNELSPVLRKVIDGETANVSFEDVYRRIYNIVMAGQGALVYNGLRELLVAHLQQTLKERIMPVLPKGLEGKEYVPFLRAFTGAWESYFDGVKRIGTLATCLRSYSQNHDLPEIYDLGSHLFYQHIISQSVLLNIKRSIRELKAKGGAEHSTLIETTIDALKEIREAEGKPSLYDVHVKELSQEHSD